MSGCVVHLVMCHDNLQQAGPVLCVRLCCVQQADLTQTVAMYYVMCDAVLFSSAG